MFETVASAVLPLTSELRTDGRVQWEFVSRPANVSWLQAEFVDDDYNYDSWGVHFFNDIEQLLQRCIRCKLVLKHLDLVARPKSDGPWKMHQVRRVWLVETPDGSEHALELSGGWIFLTKTDDVVLQKYRTHHFDAKQIICEIEL